MHSSPLIRTIGGLGRENPAQARVLEHISVGHCCVGTVPLAGACHERGLDPGRLAADLALLDAEREPSADPARTKHRKSTSPGHRRGTARDTR